MFTQVLYKQDWEDDKSMICFPYTITDHYDKTQDMQKLKVG